MEFFLIMNCFFKFCAVFSSRQTFRDVGQLDNKLKSCFHLGAVEHE